MKFYMLRLYTLLQEDGTTVDKQAVYVHDNETAAMKQYYKMLATDIDDATKPEVMCVVMNQNGLVIAKQKFYHTNDTTTTDTTEEDTSES